MVIVNDPGSWSHVYAPLKHAEWNGCTLTDLVFPFFLFVVGVSITLAYSRRLEAHLPKKDIYKKIIFRTIKIYLLGLFLWLWPDFDFGAIRWAGVLQRISVVFLVCALLFLNTNWKTQIKIAAGILVAYVLLWRDECAVELGDLATALPYVNMVRIRARDGNRIMGLCTSYELNPGVAPVVDYTQEAANYDVQPYTAFTSADYARKAVHHELCLEFGMEGYRFYDLVRWGIAADVINNFIIRDIGFRIFLGGDIPAVYRKGTEIVKYYTAGRKSILPLNL